MRLEMKLRWKHYPRLRVQVQFNHASLKVLEVKEGVPGRRKLVQDVKVQLREMAVWAGELLNKEMCQAHQEIPEFAKVFLCD